MKGLQYIHYGLSLAWLLVSCWTAGAVLDFELATPSSSVDNGKARLSEMMKNSNLPINGGTCWKSALELLETGCKSLSEDAQARMTFRFTSCYNEMFGLPAYICEPTTPIQTCMKQLDANGMATFRDYFLHTQDMCYYLRQEVWQEQTNNAVTRLTDAATDVTTQMEVQKSIQEQIFVSQQESMKVQSNMKKDNEDLYNTVVKVRDVFEDFSETAKEHRMISSDIFDKLSKMQKLIAWIQGEMSLFDVVFFYFGALVFVYFSTATTRTRSARFWLIILFIIGIVLEKVVYSYFTERGFSPEEVQEYRWVVRKIAAVFGCLIVIIQGAMYRDIQSVNNAMLMHMNLKLDRLLSGGIMIDEPSQKSINAHQASLETSVQQQQDDDKSSDEYEDSFSNYSTDDSADNLEHELKDLLQEDIENDEKPLPSGLSKLGRFFGREPNEKISPVAAFDRSRHSYNLRERSATPRRDNPAFQNESTTDFARSIKKRAPKPIATRPNYFSSDEEN